MKSAYISCPMSVSQTILIEVIDLVRDCGTTARWWPKGTQYDENYYKKVIVEETDAFIVILPDLKWSYACGKMTSGSHKELSLAIEANKPLFIAYKSRNDGLGIYAAEIMEVSGVRTITGIHSTRYNFRDSAKAVKYTTESKDKLNRDKTWLQTHEELYREELINLSKLAIFPSWIDTSSISPVNLEKTIDYFQQIGILLLDTNTKLDIRDNRIVLFF
jgi:hypothetical protein